MRGVDFNRRGPGLLKKIRQIKRALDKGFTLQQILDNKTTESYNKKPITMIQFKSYTRKEVESIKFAIQSGESINNISKKLSVEFGRTRSSVLQKIYSINRRFPKLKSTPVIQKVIEIEPVVQQCAEIGIKIPDGMTFEGKPRKIMLHSDHFRIYF